MCSASTSALKPAMPPNAQRHPAKSPISAPSGTPSTEAAATPPKMMEVARPIDAWGTSRAASPPAIAQMPPMQKPTRTRAASSQISDGASAEARLASTSRASSPHRMRRRSMPPAAITTSGANSAASSAGSEIIRPALPMEVPRLPAMDVSRPTGSISVVTTEKVARPTADTASHGRRAAGSGRVEEDEFMVQIPSNRWGVLHRRRGTEKIHTLRMNRILYTYEAYVNNHARRM